MESDHVIAWRIRDNVQGFVPWNLNWKVQVRFDGVDGGQTVFWFTVADLRSAFYAMDEAMKDFKHKIAGLPIKHLDEDSRISCPACQGLSVVAKSRAFSISFIRLQVVCLLVLRMLPPETLGAPFKAMMHR